MKRLLLIAVLCAGCSQSNATEWAKALAADPNPWCVVGGYGPAGVMAGRGSPQVNVKLTPGGCEMNGNNVTNVAVPVGNVTVTPK